MPSKLQKAIGAVKDQTSLSLAKVAKSHSIDVAVLKATSHDDVPVDDRHVTEVLALVSSDPTRVKLCAHAIARRVGRTRNWIVALKSLVLVERILQNDTVSFPKEVQNANILNLKNFRDDDSNSSPRDFFVGAFAHYLHDRVESILTGRLGDHPVLLDKIVTWQRLLDRIIGIKPAGSAKNNRLIQNSLYEVVRESFDLHRDVSDGLALLLGTFFHLPYDSCLNAFQAFLKASEQFKELSEFYDFCKKIEVGTTSEYPNVQNMSEELLETLREFLKDQCNFPCPSPSPAPELSTPAPTDSISDFDVMYRSDRDDDDSKANHDDGSSSSVPVDRVSVSNSILDQSGHEYNQSWEIVLFDEPKSKSSESKQCVDIDILSCAMPSQRWTNPFLNELSGGDIPANSSSPATCDRNNPFNAPSDYNGSTFRAIPEEAVQEDANVTSNDSNNCLPSFSEMPLQNDPFTPATPPEWRSIAHMPLQSDPFAHVTPPQRHSISHIPLQNDAFMPAAPPERHSLSQMPLQNDLFVSESRNIARLSAHNVPLPPATPPECHSATQMPPNNDLFVPATQSQHRNDPFLPESPSHLQNARFQPATPSPKHITTQISLHKDPFGPATPTQLQNVPFLPATPSQLQNVLFSPATPPQSHITTQMLLDNDPFGRTTPTQSHNVPFLPATPPQQQNVLFSPTTPPQSHITTQMSLHNDPFGPATPTQLQNVPFTPATPPQLQNVLLSPATPPQSHITTQMSLDNDPFGFTTPTQSQNVPLLPATPPQSHITTQMPPHNDLFVPATPPQSHSTTHMQPQNDPFAPATQSQRHNILQLENDPFAPTTTSPQRHNTTQMPLHNDPFAPTTPSQSHNTGQLLQQNDPFAPIKPFSVQNDPFAPAVLPQRHIRSKMQLQNENDPFASAIVPQRHIRSKMQLQNENDPFASAIVPQRHSVSARDTNQPTFQASPTFFANEPNNTTTLQNGDDPFVATVTSEGQDMSHEQQLWLEYQDKIIAKLRT